MKEQTPWDSLGMTPYHDGAGCVVNAGAICMLIFTVFGGYWPIAGFFIGAAPVFILYSWYYTNERERFNAEFGRNEKGE